MRDNRLLAHLLKKSTSPPVWLTVVFALAVAGWGIASMLPGLNQMLDQITPMPEEHALLYFAALLFLFGTPVAVAANGAIFTADHARPENLKATRLKSLTGPELAWGYSLATLHRMRVLIALAVGLGPVYAIASTETVLTMYRIGHPLCASGPCDPFFASSSFDATSALITNGLIALGVIGLTPFAAAVSTWLALSLRKTILASALSVLSTVLMIGALLAFVGPGVSVPLVLAAGLMLAPWLMALGIVFLTGKIGASPS